MTGVLSKYSCGIKYFTTYSSQNQNHTLETNFFVD